MAKATPGKTQPNVEKEGLKLLRQTEEVPRFKSARRARALIEAIQYNKSKLAIWFLRHGFDPNAKDSKNRSALYWAAHWCRSSVIVELVKRGARLPDDVLIGPINEGGDEKLIQLLIRHGANVNCYASRYSPFGHHSQLKRYVLSYAMARAALEGNESIPVMLIRAGARINQLVQPRSHPGMENRSMLGIAASDGLMKTVRAMIAAGADANMRDNRGRTALTDAIESGHAQIAKALMRAGGKQ